MNRVDEFEDRKLLEAFYYICRSYISTLLKVFVLSRLAYSGYTLVRESKR